MFRYLKKMSNSILFALFVFSIISSDAAEKDDIDWKITSKEVDNLPFSSSFIDSVKNEFNFSAENRSIRRIENHTKRKETLERIRKNCSFEKVISNIVYFSEYAKRKKRLSVFLCAL